MTRLASHLWIFTLCVVALASFACGQSDPASSAGEVVSDEADDLGDAARTGAAAEAVKAVEKWSDDVQAKVNEQGLGKTVEDAAKDAAARVEQSDAVFEAAYDKARADGEGRLDAASEGYNAVDRHHVPIGEEPQTR